jgi:predicted MFS family arabinose efflux permease
VLAVAVALLLRDPPRVQGGPQGRFIDLLRLRALWFILPITAVNYLPAAGLRGLWAGPYLTDIFGMDTAGIGRITLLMGCAMVLGNFAYGPMDRILGTRKWLVFGGNGLVFLGLAGLWAMPAQGPVFAAVLLAGIGFFGSSFPMLVAHGRAFFPAHLVGRGVSLLNLFSIGGAGLAQLYAGRLQAGAASPDAAYAAIFGFFALALFAGLLIYAFAQDRVD